MLVGGMPQTIETYLKQNNLEVVDETKREIIDLYEEDFTKIDAGVYSGIYDSFFIKVCRENQNKINVL